MTQPIANCPNCGAKITFRWSACVQTICDYCKSILIRTDVDLQKVGQVADLPPTVLPSKSEPRESTESARSSRSVASSTSTIRGIGMNGTLMMNDGTSGWLSDAQLDYAVTFAAAGQKLPRDCRVGQKYTWNGQTYTVSTVTKAHYCGVEGELPFQYWDKSDVVFVDLMSHSEKFATIDYSEDPPLLFLGEAVEFEVSNSRIFAVSRDGREHAGPTPAGAPQVKSLNCPGCGASLDGAFVRQRGNDDLRELPLCARCPGSEVEDPATSSAWHK